jgi:hypothetical protein
MIQLNVTLDAQKWEQYNAECADNPQFIGKYTEIQMKISKAAAEL